MKAGDEQGARPADLEELVRRLAETEEALQALATGRLDAIVDPASGAPILLREAQAALRADRARLQLLLEQLPSIVWTTDRRLRVTSTLGAGLGVLGGPAAGLEGLDLEAAVERGELSGAALAAHRWALDGEQVTYEVHWGGRTFHACVEPYRGGAGEIVGCLGVALDITERTAAEEALRQAHADLEARVEQRTGDLLEANEALQAEMDERRLAEERVGFLAQAGSVLAASLDFEETLQSIACLAVPVLADCCLLDVLEEDGMRGAAACHADPEQAAPLAELQRRRHPRWDLPQLHGGGPLLAEEVGERLPWGDEQDPGAAEVARSLAVRSALSVPLLARGQLVGVLNLGYCDSERRYGPEDVALAQDLAHRAALAVDNARLYRQAQAALAARDRALAEETAARRAAERLAADVKARADQQAVMAALGQCALAGATADELLDDAVIYLAQTLDVPWAAVLELLPDGGSLRLRAGSDWPEEPAGSMTVGTGTGSQAGYTLLEGGPLVVDDLAAETRFEVEPLLTQLGAASALSVPIQVGERPFGVLLVHSPQPGRFGQDDVHFGQAVASLLGMALAGRQAEQELRAGRQKFESLFNVLPVGVSLLDEEHRVIDANPALSAILHVSHEDLLAGAAHQRRLVWPDGTPVAPEDLPSAQALRDHEPVPAVDFGVVVEDGRTVWVNVRAAPLPGLGAVVVTGDVTDRVEAEQARERERERVAEIGRALALERDTLHTIMENTPAQLAYFDLDFNFLRVNSAYARGSGYAAEALLGRNHFELFPNAENRALFERVRDTGEGLAFRARPFDHPERPERGTTYWDWSLTPVKDQAGQVRGLVQSLLEVTERERLLDELDGANERLRAQAEELGIKAEELSIQAEELEQQNRELMRATASLAAERRRYQDLFEAAPDGYIVTDLNGVIQEANHAATALLGVEAKYLAGKPLTVFVAGEERRKLLLALRDLTLRSAPRVRLDVSLSPRERPRLPVSVEAVAAYDASGLPAALRWLLHDVSEHKHLEEQLRRARDELEQRVQERTGELAEANRVLRYQAGLLANVSDAVLATDAVGLITAWNHAAEALYGWPAPEVLGRPLAEVLPSVPVEAGEAQAELSLRRRDGTPLAVEARSMTLTGPDGRPAGYVAVHRDVTERKRMEAELRRREALWSKVLEMLPVGVWVTDPEGRIISGNPAALRIWADARYVGLDEYRQYKAWWLDSGRLIEPDEWAVSRAVRLGQTSLGELIDIEAFDGRRKTIVNSAVPLYTESGGLMGVIVVNEDVTERLAAERALAESETRYRQMFEKNWAIKLLIDPETGEIVDANPAAAQFYGYDPDELRGLSIAAINTLSPEQVAEEMARARWQERTYFTFRHRLSSGEEREVEVYSSPIVAQGRTLLYSIVHDITERVQAFQLLEQRVAERTRELSTLLDIARQVALSFELEPLLDLVLDSLAQVVPYEGVGIWQQEGASLVPLLQRGGAEERASGRVALADAPVARQVIGGQQPVIIDDVQADEPLAQLFRRARVASPWLDDTLPGVRSWLGVPLIVQDHAFGLLALYHSRPGFFVPRHAELAAAFASSAALAMENVRLAEQARKLARLEERQRLARDLHDAVSQTLFSASLIAEVLPTLWERNQEAGRRSLEDLHQLTRGALAEMRTLLMELRPGALLELGLEDLLPQLADVVTGRSRIPVRLDLEDLPALPADIQVNLYRIAQEALSNVAKHSAASCATISLHHRPPAEGEAGPGGLVLTIVDDGGGFDPENISANSLGLDIMRERAAEVGARLTIESRAGSGTQIEVVWPA